MFIINDNTRPLTKALLFAMLFLPICLFAQQKHALLIGISDYPQYEYADASWEPIHGTNDVHLISPLLAKQGFSINVLLNEAATHSAIENGFERLERDVQPGDIVYIHLSGHGQAVEDEDGDEADGWDEAFIPYDAERSYREEGYHGEKHLLDDELNGYLISIRRKVGKTGIVYVALDACHAGSSYRGEEEQDSVYVRGTEIGFSKTGKTYTPRINQSGNLLRRESAHARYAQPSIRRVVPLSVYHGRVRLPQREGHGGTAAPGLCHGLRCGRGTRRTGETH